MRTFCLKLVLALATTALVAGSIPAGAQDADKVIAKVNGYNITTKEVALASDETDYNRHVGVLSYEDEVFVTLVVESYNLTEYSNLPLTAFRITPYILNLGTEPIEKACL